MTDRVYRGVNISRSTRPNALRWGAYVGDHFVYADTLDGIKALIREVQQGRA